MGWLSKLQRRKRAQRHDISSMSSSTVNTTSLEKTHHPAHHEQDNDSKEEEMLRKVIRRIMIEEAEKLDEEDNVAELVKKEALVIQKLEEKTPPAKQAPPLPPREDPGTAPSSEQEEEPTSQVTANTPRASSEPTTPTASRVTPSTPRARSSGASQGRHQRSIQDVLAGTPPDDISAMETESIASYIHPENVTNKQFDATVKHVFPGALDNYSLIKQVSSLLLEKQGYVKANTLLATSFCCDEASRQLEDDLEDTYGRNFNLGGLAGFPWAGQTGFGAMAHHIPEGGHCLLVYGPHVGITKEGLVGKVERAGICKPDTCCGSAVAASNYVQEITDGKACITTNLNSFTDFQQGAVQQMILPHCKRLDEANDRMLELPYALYESQDLLMTTIAKNGASATPMGVVLLGGIQINTGPTTPDYFHPLRFQYMNVNGEIVDDYLAEFCERSGSKHDADGRIQTARKSIFAMGGGNNPATIIATGNSTGSTSLGDSTRYVDPAKPQDLKSPTLSPMGRRISQEKQQLQAFPKS